MWRSRMQSATAQRSTGPLPAARQLLHPGSEMATVDLMAVTLAFGLWMALHHFGPPRNRAGTVAVTRSREG